MKQVTRELENERKKQTLLRAISGKNKGLHLTVCLKLRSAIYICEKEAQTFVCALDNG